MSDSRLARSKPCSNCPWRRDAPPGEFAAERYRLLRDTAGQPGNEVPIGGPIFACHKTPEGRELACAGWLAVVGYYHLGMRLAVAQRRLDGAQMSPGEGWPALYASYDELAAVNGANVDDPPEPASRAEKDQPIG